MHHEDRFLLCTPNGIISNELLDIKVPKPASGIAINKVISTTKTRRILFKAGKGRAAVMDLHTSQ